MEFHSKKEGKVAVIKLTGRLDAITTPEYETKVKKLIDEGEALLVIDFDDLAYISSAGLRGLLSTAKQIKAKSGQVCFANVKGPVKEVFAISGFQSIFTMHDSLTTALAALA
jgi:stage II sporulation protein AA (anti-sigma F factor antagonist)